MPVVVNIQDLFLREAVELGMLTNPVLIRIFEVMERQMHRLAKAMTVHSLGNREYVIERGGQPEHVHVVYNWVNAERIRPDRRDNDFAQEHGLVYRLQILTTMACRMRGRNCMALTRTIPLTVLPMPMKMRIRTLKST
jgi:hypothetical protein